VFKDYDYFGAFMMVIGAAAFAALGWGSITGKMPKKPRGDYDWIPSVALGFRLAVSADGLS